jgi:hypothetical protein
MLRWLQPIPPTLTKLPCYQAADNTIPPTQAGALWNKQTYLLHGTFLGLQRQLFRECLFRLRHFQVRISDRLRSQTIRRLYSLLGRCDLKISGRRM